MTRRRLPPRPCPDCGAPIPARKKRCGPCSDLVRERRAEERRRASGNDSHP
jgi:predicted nucleic acid-binding Zn ribbon protein